MFFGQHTTQLKNNKTISLPEKFAKDIHSNLFLTQGFDGNLVVMPEKAFLRLYQRTSTMNIANPLTRLFLRHFLANATFVSQSKINQIEISAYLAEYAGFPKEKRIVLVGQGDHIEIWGQKKWQEQSKELQDACQNADRFVMLDI
jgi:MraZ protein